MQSTTTSDVAAYVAAELADEEREPQEIQVVRLTQGIFEVRVKIHGEPEPEAYMLHLDQDGQ